MQCFNDPEIDTFIGDNFHTEIDLDL